MGVIRKPHNKANVSEIYVQRHFHCRSRYITIKNIAIVMVFIVLFLKGVDKISNLSFPQRFREYTSNVNHIEKLN